MLIYHVSDLHGDWTPVFSAQEKPDLWILSGDLLYNYRDHVREPEYQKKELEEIILALIDSFQNTPVLVQNGNHDFINIGETMQELGIPNVYPVTTSSQTILVNGTPVSFAGFPNVPIIHNPTRAWNHVTDDVTLACLVDQVMSEDIDLMINHAPPDNILSGRHGGIHALTSQLMYRPHNIKGVFFGHSHDSCGVMEENGILFSNAATQLNKVSLEF